MKWIPLSIALAACGFPRPADVRDSGAVGGNVHGLWTGADGVVLRLTTEGIDTLYTVTANGPFSFPTILAEGVSYVVGIEASPTKHTCVIASGANGIVGVMDIASIDVACTGPAVSIALSAPDPWIFDPTVDLQQTLNASVLLQNVTLTITNSDGLVISTQVAHMPAILGKPSAPQVLALGTTVIDIDMMAQGGLAKTYQVAINRGANVLKQAAYAKASNTGINDEFGYSVAISGDTLVVGALESSSSTGVNGDQMNDNAPGAGAVYVFQRTRASWTQQAYLKASNTDAFDTFGHSVSISGDTLAVGARGEDSRATTINGDQLDNSAPAAGAVYVFQRIGTTWTQQAYIKASNAEADDNFGYSVALSGATLAVGAWKEGSSATGIDGAQLDNSASRAGAVYVFQRAGSTWTQQAYIKASNTEAGDQFGWSVAVSGDTLAVGAIVEASSATGVNGNQSDNSMSLAGAVYVFHRNGIVWEQQAYVKATNTSEADGFGAAVALFEDTLAVGATGESSSATGVNGNQTDMGAQRSGAVYVYQRTGTAWAPGAYIKASNTGAGDGFGVSLAISGEMLAVGASTEKSSAVGVDGNQEDNSANDAGAVYVFRRSGTSWAQHAYVKASNTTGAYWFGSPIALSGDTFAVASLGEASGATGIDGAQSDRGAPRAGAVYLFR